MDRRRVLLGGLVAAMVVAGLGLWRGEFFRVESEMTYGNFDVPNDHSFVQHLLSPGVVVDHAQRPVYRFDAGTTWRGSPLVGVGLVFAVFLALQLGGAGRREELKRRVSQWLVFVATRLGVLRVADLCPLRRSTLGVLPVLNCQACEMATGACPIGTLQHFLMGLQVPLFTLASMAFFGLALGRWACGWLCPFGMLSDLADRISLHRWRPAHAWRALKFVVLGLVVVLALLFGLVGWTAVPFCVSICPAGKVLGLLPYYVTTAALEVRDAVFAPFAAPRAFLMVWFHLGVALAFLGLMVMVAGRVYCSLVCPLGAFLGLFHKVAGVRVAHVDGACTGCGRCLDVCPTAIDLRHQDFLTQSDCISCGRCIRACEPGARVWDLPWAAPAPPEASASPAGARADKSAGCAIPLRGKIVRALLPLLAYTPQNLARYARRHVPFYRRRYAGLDPDEFDRLPLIDKRELRALDPYDLLSDLYRDEVSYYGETTGSSGSPTPSFLTAREFGGAALLSQMTPYAAKMSRLFREENRTCINGIAFGFSIAGMSFGDLLVKNGGLVANLGTRSTLSTPVRMADALARLRPGLVAAAPIDFLSWMRIVAEDHPAQVHEVLRRLRVLMSTAELCAPSRVRAIERHFGIDHVDSYASVEGFFTMACPCGQKHVLPIYLVELFDGDLKPLGRYGRGRLAFTNLLKRSSPLIRYLLDDLVTVSPSLCPWGFKVDIVPHGRWELSVRLHGEVLNVGDFEDEIFREGLFGDYRVRLLEGDRAEVVLEDYAAPPGAAARVAERLAKRFELEVQATVVPFGRLTAYREVRVVKPILKLEDLRRESRQEVPLVI